MFYAVRRLVVRDQFLRKLITFDLSFMWNEVYLTDTNQHIIHGTSFSINPFSTKFNQNQCRRFGNVRSDGWEQFPPCTFTTYFIWTRSIIINSYKMSYTSAGVLKTLRFTLNRQWRGSVSSISEAPTTVAEQWANRGIAQEAIIITSRIKMLLMHVQNIETWRYNHYITYQNVTTGT
jgi:hypothetical protein